MKELTKVDLKILELLKEGYTQHEIGNYFKESGEFKIKSFSSIEKKLFAMRKHFGVKTLFQLGMIMERDLNPSKPSQRRAKD